jgi:hypothetical protein
MTLTRRSASWLLSPRSACQACPSRRVTENLHTEVGQLHWVLDTIATEGRATVTSVLNRRRIEGG